MLVLTTLAVAWVGASPVSANAAVGDLTFTSCIGQLTGCTATSPATAVSGPDAVAVAPDGRSVYVGSGTTIDEFSRDTTTGALTFTGCIGQTAGCTTTNPADAVYGPASVVVSPDGASVYAASTNANAVDEFSRDPATGALTFMGCIGQHTGCAATTPADAASGPTSVAISADGASVYAAASTAQSIDTFSRNTFTGALTLTSCIGQASGCTTTTPVRAVSSPASVAVSPDGASVYAGSNASSGVDVFTRNTITGALSFQSCIGQLAGCTPTNPAGAVSASYSVVVSPDGANVYSVDGGSVLSTFSRASGSGALTFTNCVGQLTGCATTTPAAAVSTPISSVVSPDGANVYVAADGADSVDVFSRSTSDGSLTFTGCVGQLSGCTATSPAGAIAGPSGVAISPDGASVYAASVDANAVDLFLRAIPPAPGGGGGGGGGGKPPPPCGQLCNVQSIHTYITSGPSGRTASDPEFTFTSNFLHASFECRFDNEPFAPCSSPLIRFDLSYGKHTFLVRARAGSQVDPVGDSRTFDIEPETREFSCTVDANTIHEPYGLAECDFFGTCPAYSLCQAIDARVPSPSSALQGDGEVHVTGCQLPLPPGQSLRECGAVNEVAWNFCNFPSGEPNPCPTAFAGFITKPPPPVSRFGGSCVVYANPGASGHATCSVTLQIKPATPFNVLPSGAAGGGVFVPVGGRVAITPAGGKPAADVARAGHKAKGPFAPIRLRATQAGWLLFKFKLSRSSKATLLRRHLLRLPLQIVFTPNAGAPVLKTQQIALTLPSCVTISVPKPPRGHRSKHPALPKPRRCAPKL